MYRDPVARLLSLRWSLSREDAEDLTQEFFTAAIEKEWFARYDAGRGRFRAFLRRCLDDFTKTTFRDAARLKRGGDAQHVALETEDVGAPADAERLFEREWAKSVLAIASERLRAECVDSSKEVAWRLFERYDLTDAPDESRPTYAALGLEFGAPVTQVTNHLSWARRRMRDHVLATLRSLTGDDEEYRDEVRSLLGAVRP